MLKRIRLQNFKKHDNLDITFGDGLTGVFGGNYAGKSTILHGIKYCLGGASYAPGKDLQRRGTNTGFCQELWFSTHGEDFYVLRKKSAARLYKGEDGEGELIAAGTKPVNEAIEKLLGMSMKRFCQLRVASQKKTDAMLSLGAAELHRIIEDLSGADQVDQALTKLKDKAVYLRGQLEGVALVDVEGLDKEQKSIETQLKSATEAAKKSKTQFEQSIKIKDAAGVKLQEYDSLGKAHRKAAGEKMRLEMLIASKTEESEKLKKRVAETPVQSDDVLQKMSADLLEMTDYLRQLKSCNREVVELKPYITAKQETLSKIEQRINDCVTPEIDELTILDGREKIREVKESITLLIHKRTDLDSTLKSAVCRTCKRAFDNAHEEEIKKSLKACAAELEGLELKLKDLEIPHQKNEKLLRDKDLILRELKVLKQDHVSVQKALNDSENRLAKATDSIEALVANHPYGSEAEVTDQIQNLRVKVNQFKSQNLLAKGMVGELEQLQKSLAEYRLNLSKVPVVEYDTEAHDKAKQWLEKTNQQVFGFHRESMELETKANNLSAENKRLLGAIHSGLKINEHHGKLSKELDTCQALQKYLKSNRDRYMSEVWDTFMARASNFASACTGGAIEQVIRTEEGKFKYVEDGFEMDVVEASGAQQSLMGLGVQLAMADAASCPVDVVLLDEPSDSMDEEHSMAMAAMLAGSGVQVVTVSHNAMDSSVCGHVINL